MDGAGPDPLWAASLEGLSLISITALHVASWDDRVWLSAGTCIESHANYTPGSVVPIQQWRRIGPGEERVISNERDPSRHVGLHELDAEIWRRLKVACGTPNSANSDRRSLLTELLDYLALNVARFGDETHIIGFNRSVAENFTLTRDRHLPRTEKIGLHIDSWDGGRLDDRAERSQRICINLGESSRYFLFVNRPITQMRQDAGDCPNETVSRFLRAHPNYPVVALRVDPGECYLAPTELIIHDGWNPYAGVNDDTFTVRSRFQAL